jgi:hypothetical protein
MVKKWYDEKTTQFLKSLNINSRYKGDTCVPADKDDFEW